MPEKKINSSYRVVALLTISTITCSSPTLDNISYYQQSLTTLDLSPIVDARKEGLTGGQRARSYTAWSIYIFLCKLSRRHTLNIIM